MAINLADDGQDWMEKLKRYASDQTGAQAEYARANAKYNYQNSIGDTAGADASKKWMGQVDTATGGLLSKPTSKVDSAMDKFEQYLNNSMNRTPFNPATDQQYQSSLAAAQQNAAKGVQTAQNNTQAQLRATGRGRSSYADTVANQIAQEANTNIQLNLEPQIMQQAYQRWMDQQNLAQQDLSNLGEFASMTNNQFQQGLDNAYRDRTFAETQKLNNLNAAQQVGDQLGRVIAPKSDWSNLYNQTNAPLNMQGQQVEYQKARDAIADKQYQQKFDEDVRQFGISSAIQRAQLAGQLANQGADNAIAQQRLAWDMNLDSPDNQYKIAQANATSNGKASETNSKIINLRQMYTAKDSLTGEIKVTDPAALRSAIIANGSSEDEIDKMLQYFGIANQNTINSGGR